MYKKLNIKDVASWFLSKKPMTNKKLQKLLYLSYGYYVATYNNNGNINNELFDNNFEAWIHGPVDPEIYQEYKEAGFNIIQIKVKNKSINEKAEKILNHIIKIYGNYDAEELEKITHNQLPWIKARGNKLPYEPSNEKINTLDIYEYFKGNHMWLAA